MSSGLRRALCPACTQAVGESNMKYRVGPTAGQGPAIAGVGSFSRLRPLGVPCEG